MLPPLQHIIDVVRMEGKQVNILSQLTQHAIFTFVTINHTYVSSLYSFPIKYNMFLYVQYKKCNIKVGKFAHMKVGKFHVRQLILVPGSELQQKPYYCINNVQRNISRQRTNFVKHIMYLDLFLCSTHIPFQQGLCRNQNYKSMFFEILNFLLVENVIFISM